MKCVLFPNIKISTSFFPPFHPQLAGAPPFEADNAVATYELIQAAVDSVPFPADVEASKEAGSFVQSLLQIKPTQRLGVAGGVQKVKNHAWFKGFDWAALESRAMTPPHVPKVKLPQAELCHV